ncbi:hypothetical protein [Corynebacterium sp.]|uniref:hypothetical protein n=1 Tax=Corynebacterium sp. TaxID=1720 RepID=UPI00262DF529|nr:hypothetical protein [Corynebacterium sp.]
MQLGGEKAPAKKPKKIPPLASIPKPGYNFLRIPAGLRAEGPAGRFLSAAPAAVAATTTAAGSAPAVAGPVEAGTKKNHRESGALPATAPVASSPVQTPAATATIIEQSSPQNTVDLATLGRWIVLWLEAREGRRAPMSLRRGPYSPAVIEDLRRASSPATGGARLLRVHAQKTRFGQIRFSASAFYDGRVRAIAGFLDDGEGRHGTRSPQRSRGELRAGLWRVEQIHLI